MVRAVLCRASLFSAKQMQLIQIQRCVGSVGQFALKRQKPGVKCSKSQDPGL